MDKKDKKNLAKMCICGHTKGQHSYVEHRRCLQVMSCKCKGFSEVKE